MLKSGKKEKEKREGGKKNCCCYYQSSYRLVLRQDPAIMLQLVGVLYVRVSVCDDWNVRSSRTILIEIACDSNWNNEAIKF